MLRPGNADLWFGVIVTPGGGGLAAVSGMRSEDEARDALLYKLLDDPHVRWLHSLPHNRVIELQTWPENPAHWY